MRQLRIGALRIDICAHQRVTIGIDQRCEGQRARDSQRGQNALKAARILIVGTLGLLQLGGDPDDVIAQHLSVFEHIGARNQSRAFDHRAGALGEPLIEALIERNGGDHRNDHRGHGRNNGKHRHHANLHAGAGLTLDAGLNEQRSFRYHESDHQEHKNAGDDPDHGPDCGRGFNLGRARQNQEREQRHQHRSDDDDEAENAQRLITL